MDDPRPNPKARPATSEDTWRDHEEETWGTWSDPRPNPKARPAAKALPVKAMPPTSKAPPAAKVKATSVVEASAVAKASVVPKASVVAKGSVAAKASVINTARAESLSMAATTRREQYAATYPLPPPAAPPASSSAGRSEQPFAEERHALIRAIKAADCMENVLALEMILNALPGGPVPWEWTQDPGTAGVRPAVEQNVPEDPSKPGSSPLGAEDTSKPGSSPLGAQQDSATHKLAQEAQERGIWGGTEHKDVPWSAEQPGWQADGGGGDGWWRGWELYKPTRWEDTWSSWGSSWEAQADSPAHATASAPEHAPEQPAWPDDAWTGADGWWRGWEDTRPWS